MKPDMVDTKMMPVTKPYGIVEWCGSSKTHEAITCRAHREIHDLHPRRVRRPGLRRGCHAHHALLLLLLVLLRARRQWLRHQHQRRQQGEMPPSLSAQC